MKAVFVSKGITVRSKLRRLAKSITDARIADGVTAAIKILAAAVDVNVNRSKALTPPLPVVAELATIA